MGLCSWFGLLRRKQARHDFTVAGGQGVMGVDEFGGHAAVLLRWTGVEQHNLPLFRPRRKHRLGPAQFFAAVRGGRQARIQFRDQRRQKKIARLLLFVSGNT